MRSTIVNKESNSTEVLCIEEDPKYWDKIPFYMRDILPKKATSPNEKSTSPKHKLIRGLSTTPEKYSSPRQHAETQSLVGDVPVKHLSICVREGRRFLFEREVANRRLEQSGKGYETLSTKVETIRGYVNEIKLSGIERLLQTDEDPELLKVLTPRRPKLLPDKRLSVTKARKGFVLIQKPANAIPRCEENGEKSSDSDLHHISQAEINSVDHYSSEINVKSAIAKVVNAILMGSTSSASASKSSEDSDQGLVDAKSNLGKNITPQVGSFSRQSFARPNVARSSFVDRESRNSFRNSFNRGSFNRESFHDGSSRGSFNSEEFAEDASCPSRRMSFKISRTRQTMIGAASYDMEAAASELGKEKTENITTKILAVFQCIKVLVKLKDAYELKQLEGRVASNFNVALLVLRAQARLKFRMRMKEMQQRINARIVIMRRCGRKIMSTIYTIRSRKADLLIKFLGDINKHSKIVMLVKSFKHRVAKCQRWYREFQLLSKARHTALCILWDRLLNDFSVKIEDQKKGWDIFIPNNERDSILFAYLRERRWNFRKELIEYISRVVGHKFKFTHVRLSHVKEFLFQNQVQSDDEDSSIGDKKNHNSSTKGFSFSSGYIPQLLEAKLDQERPFVCLYSSKLGIQYLKNAAERLYMRHHTDYNKKIFERLREQKNEKKKTERLLRTLDVKDREDTKKIISIVNKIILESPRLVDEDIGSDVLKSRTIAHLQRPTIAYAMGMRGKC